MTNTATQASTVMHIQAAPQPESVKPLTLTQRIDADEGLKAKRKLLSVVSLILLAIVFSGAKVVEANTFIMKISFTNQNGIAHLLLLSIVFLMIRYYNYARPYHDELYNKWTDRMLSEPFFYSSNPNEHELAGIVMDRTPQKIDVDRIYYEQGSFDFKYKCSWLFVRKFTYIWTYSEQDDYQVIDVRVGWRGYLKVLAYETKHQFKSYFTHRENLDILAPYLLGSIAIMSFVLNEEVIAIIKGFTS